MSGHTPGPWVVGDANYTKHSEIGIHAGDYIIADMCGDVPSGKHDQYANASLMAAAPQLLEALRVAREYALYMQPEPDDIALIEAAIAKATGAQP